MLIVFLQEKKELYIIQEKKLPAKNHKQSSE